MEIGPLNTLSQSTFEIEFPKIIYDVRILELQ